MCVETLRTGIVFLRWLTWGVTCLCLLKKMNCFPIYLLRNAINVGWNPQHRACFSEMIDFRGHMPRFTWENELFFHLSPEKCQKCVLECSEQGSFFCDDQFEGSHAKAYSQNKYFPIYLLSNHHKFMLKCSEQWLFFQDDWLEGSHT